MNKSQETRKRNEQYRRERRERESAEIKAQAAALRQIRDNPQATPGNAWRPSSCLWSCRDDITTSCEKERATWTKLYRFQRTIRMYEK